MNSDAENDLQAYINQISQKAKDLKHEVEESSGSISTPTHISSFEIKEREVLKMPKMKDISSAKIKLLEEKYLKMPPKLTKRRLSVSWSREDFSSLGELQEPPVNRKEAAALLMQYNEPSFDSEDLGSKYSEVTGVELKDVTTMNEIYAPSSEEKEEAEKRSARKRSDGTRKDSAEVDLPFGENEEDKRSPFYASTGTAHNRRKSSTASLLMTKDSVFYSTSISTDANNPKSRPQRKASSSVIKFAKYDSNAEGSDSVPTQATESIEEEVPTPEVLSHAEEKHPLQVTRRRRSDSSVGAIRRDSDSRQIRQRSSHENRKKNSLSPAETDHQSPPARRTEEPSSERKPTKSPYRRKDDACSSCEKDPTDLHRTEKKSSKNKSGIMLTAKSKEARCSSTSMPSSSSSSSPSPSPSSSCSFSVKMKKKNYVKRKRRLKKEKELTELIIKILIKNLPLLMRDSVVEHRHSCLGLQGRTVHYESSCDACGGNVISRPIANSLIDDALRQTIGLTRQFLDAHQQLLLTHTQQNSTYSYTSLKKY